MIVLSRTLHGSVRLFSSVRDDTRDKEKMAEANAFIRDSALTLISLPEEYALRPLLCTLQTSSSNLPATGETFESEFVADEIWYWYR